MKESIASYKIRLSNRLLLGILALFLFSGYTSHSIYSQSDFKIENVVFNIQQLSVKSLTFKQALHLHFLVQEKVNYSLQEASYSLKSRVAFKVVLQSYIGVEKNDAVFYRTLYKKEELSPLLAS